MTDISPDQVRDEFAALVRELYPSFVAAAKIAEFEQAHDPRHPFHTQGGTTRHFTTKDKDQTAAHAAAMLDPRLPSIGFIGFFEARDDMALALEVLDAALEYLRVAGVAAVYGPVNLSTWQTFRAAHAEENSPFLFEPYARTHLRSFLEERARSIFDYVSILCPTAEAPFLADRTIYEELSADGYTFPPFSNELLDIHQTTLVELINEAFQDTTAFTPLTTPEATQLIGPLLTATPPTFHQFVFDSHDKLVAFTFAYRDPYAATARVIVKTMAVARAHRGLGLAKAMLYRVQQAALEQKIETLIYSTMRTDNPTILKLVDAPANKEYRRYSLYQFHA